MGSRCSVLRSRCVTRRRSTPTTGVRRSARSRSPLLPAVGLHLALGLPDGSLHTTARRVTALRRLRGVGRARRRISSTSAPTSRSTPVVIVSAVFALVAVVGFFARCRPRAARTNVRDCSGSRGRSSSRARSPSWSPCCTSWCRGPKRSAASRRRPRCSSRCRWRSERRSASRCASTASSCTPSRWPGSRPWWRRATCSSSSVSAGRRRVTSRRCSGCRCSRPRLPRCCGSRSASGSPTSPRVASTASATRPTRCCARSGAGSRAALPLDELLLQLAESLKKTMALAVAEVWTRGDRRPRACGVGARARHRDASRSARKRSRSSRRAGVSGVAWAKIWLPASSTATTT